MPKEDFDGARRVLIAAIDELRELRWEFSERGLDYRGHTAEILRLVNRLTELERRSEID